MSDKDKIAELQAELLEYKRLVQDYLAAPKQVAKITNGPYKQGDKQYYRAESGAGGEVVVLYNKDNDFSPGTEALKTGDEVLVQNGLVIAVTPEEIKPKPKKVDKTLLVNWNEIGGMKSQLDTIRAAIESPLKNQKLAKELGVEPIKGILLYGPPGCGKTLIAKAIANMILQEKEVDAEAFIYMKGPQVLNPYVGVAEQTIRSTFETARNYANKNGKRAVLFIDEAESILPRRGSRWSSDVDTTIVPAFLAEMDGFDSASPIVLLASNKKDSIDEAVLREGRIDMKVFIDRPTKEDAIEIFRIHGKNKKLADDVKKIAEVGVELMYSDSTCDRVSGAMVATMLNLAATQALSRAMKGQGKKGIEVEDLRNAYRSINLVE